MNFKAYHKSLEDLHVGTLKPRAYFIPYDNLQDALSGDRNKSYYMTNLCGNWKFRYFKSFEDIDESLYAENAETDALDTVKVPGNFQLYDIEGMGNCNGYFFADCEEPQTHNIRTYYGIYFKSSFKCGREGVCFTCNEKDF